MTPVKYHEGKFPPAKLEWERLIPLLGPACVAVARYDGMLSAIPNASVLLSPLMTQEAVLSSRIEGTQATMTEVLEYEAQGDKKDISEERRQDIHEVLNYRKAMWTAVEMLKDLPLCSRIVLEAHRVLLDSVRGHGKSPGEYRKLPNWIGPHGCTQEQAYYVPPEANKVPDAISRWEKYINSNQPDRLVQLAIFHAEFESIHPFLDGNGRVGRMLVPLFMYQTKLIQSPMFYISGYLEANRDVYYERLRAVSRDDDWTGWCGFFLEAVRLQAEENLRKTQAILDLYATTQKRLPKMTHSQYAIYALDWIFKRPFFEGTDFVGSSEIPAPTAYRILSVLCQENVLTRVKERRGRRSGLYVFSELVNVAEGHKVF
jgi:Fic family protein